MSKTTGRVSGWVQAVGTTGTVFLGGAAFWLSFRALTRLAEMSGVHDPWLWPLIVDGIIVVATVAVVAMAGRRGAWYPWLLLVCGAVVSVTANAIQAWMADVVVPHPMAAAVASVPPVVLLAATHLMVVLSRDTDDPVTDQLSGGPPGGRRSALETSSITPTDASEPPHSDSDSTRRTPIQSFGTSPDTESGSAQLNIIDRTTAEASTAEGGSADPVDVSGGGSEWSLDDLLREADALDGPTGPVREVSRTYAMEEAARLKAEGLSNKQIGQRLGVDPTTIGRWLKQRTNGDTDDRHHTP